MKHARIWVLLVISMVVVSTGFVMTGEVESAAGPSTFGLEIKEKENIELVNAGTDEPNNYWVHNNGLLWSQVQPDGSGTYNWDIWQVHELERYVKNANAAGMEVILIIRSTPTWAQEYKDRYCGPMKSGFIDEFAKFVVEAAKHFGPETDYHVKYFEIWNEPDQPFNEENIDPDSHYGCWGDPTMPYGGGEYYGQVLNTVYNRIQNAKLKDVKLKDVKVVMGGLLMGFDPRVEWGNNEPWKKNASASYQKFFEGILRGCNGDVCFDYVNYHSYSFYDSRYASGIEMEKNMLNWQAAGGQVEGKLSYLKEMMDKYGYSDKPIITTEAALMDYWGEIKTKYDNGFEADKADYVPWLYTRNLTLGLNATFWYHLDNYGWRKSGLLTEEDQPLPAYDAYSGVTQALAGLTLAHYQGPITTGEPSGLLGFEFQRADNSYLWVLFPTRGATHAIKVETGTSLYDWKYDPVTNSAGSVHYFNRPIYVVFSGAQPKLLFNSFIPLTAK